MPEGDTIHRTAAALHRALAGQVVRRFETALASLARVDDDRPVAGQMVDRCEAAGKHVMVRLSSGLVLRTHMRMRGAWHLYRPGERWQRSPRALRVRLDTEAWVAVAFDVSDAEFVDAADLARHRVLASLGPDLLSPAFDAQDAAARVHAAGRRPIAEVLLDQRVVAGIGNVYKSEVLFACGLHPDRPADTLDAASIVALLETAARLMHANTDAAPMGTPVAYRGPRRTTGRAAPGANLWVYDRAGRPCRRCGTPIVAAKRGADARTTYWCPRCQPPASDPLGAGPLSG